MDLLAAAKAAIASLDAKRSDSGTGNDPLTAIGRAITNPLGADVGTQDPKAPIWQHQPADFMPDTFPRAQSALATMSGPLMRVKQALGNSVGTNTAHPLLHRLGMSDIIALLPPDAVAGETNHGNDDTQMNTTAAHEAAHSAWNGMDEQTQNQWRQIHKANPFVGGPMYTNDPVESFAESYGRYAATPTQFQRENPGAYNFLRDVSGIEYARPNMNMHGDPISARDQLIAAMKKGKNGVSKPKAAAD